MKKKEEIIKYLISFLGAISILFFLSNATDASTTGSVDLSSNYEVIEKGEEVEISISIQNSKTGAFHFYLYFDDAKLDLVSSPENTNVIGNRIIYVWYDKNGGSAAKTGKLETFKFKAKEDGLASFQIEGEFYSEIGQLIQTDFKGTQVQIGKEETKLEREAKEEQGGSSQSNNATLQALRLDREGIVPNFESGVHEYYLAIANTVNEIEVLAIAENPNATVEIIGNQNLKEGLNQIKIQVTSEDKTVSNSYIIQVTKTADLALANTNLEILAIENVLLYPAFDTNVTHYQAEVAHETTNLNLLAIPENEQASVEVRGKEDLQEGDNTVLVQVTAPNGFTKKEYVIKVHRRTLEEQEEYEREQKENQEKLEEIYQVEKTSTLSDDGEKNNNDEGKQANNWIIIGIAIVAIGIVFVLAKRYGKNKKKV